MTKKISASVEQKIAAKSIQGGTKLEMNDILQSGKALNRENRRTEVKKKIGRVQQKLNDLKEKAEAEGLI